MNWEDGDIVLATRTSQLQAFIGRIELLKEKKKTISDDIKEIYTKLKGSGFDCKVVREIIRLRKKENRTPQEEVVMDRLYKAALGMR